MAFITRCWKSLRLELVVLLGSMLLGAMWSTQARAQSQGAEITELRVLTEGGQLQLTASVRFELPTAVENALIKGVPIYFEARAEIYRERWYWLDKKVASASRQMRLVYQPLTRRWRLALTAGGDEDKGPALALTQTFDTLEEALAAIRRVSGWQIGAAADIDSEAAHRLEFAFFLDVTQLPRPLQIGTLGQSDWVLGAEQTKPLAAEALK